MSLFKSKCRVWRPLPYLVTLRSLGLQISPGQVHQRGITNIHPNLFRLGEMDNWLFSNLLPGWLDTKPVYKVNCLPAHMPKLYFHPNARSKCRAWFSVGSWLSSLLCLPCLLFLIYLLYQQLCPPQHQVVYNTLHILHTS